MRGRTNPSSAWRTAPSTPGQALWTRWRILPITIALLMLIGAFAGVMPVGSPAPVAAAATTMKLPFPGGATWVVGQGYNTRAPAGTHWNCDPATLRDQPTQSESCRAHYQYKFSFDLARADGATAGQPVLAPTDGTIRWIDLSTGGMSIDLGDGYAYAFFHTNLAPGLEAGQRIQRGQRLATVAAPGQASNGGWPHIHVTLWQTTDGGNWSRIAVPFTDSHAFEGYDFPNLGESVIDQYRNRTITSTNQELGGASPGLTAPVLQSPPTGTSYRTYNPRPTLTWSPVSGASEYQVVVNDGTMTSPWLTGTVWTMPVLTNGQYAWQVRARSSSGVGPLSPKWVIWVDTTGATPPPTAPPSGSLALSSSPYSGQVGSSFSVIGSGFGAGETVRIYLDSASTSPIAAIGAQSTGSFAATVTLPNTTTGSHSFVARGMSTGRIRSSGLTVTPSLERTPYSGTPGTAVTVTVKGFGAYETVRLNWESSSGLYLGAASTNGVGTASATIRIPQGSEGWHDYVGTGSKTGARGYGAIKITTPPSPGGGTTTGGQIVGTGSYRITATREGLVGGTTSSGHVIVNDDHFVSLPTCTATSCPWLTPGVRHDKWGLRVECGSRCYVRVKNVATGACSVAPIYDVGPWFTNDDWWDPASARNLNNLSTTKTILPQAYTGADAARDGRDVGYGLAPSGIGISNKGYEVGNRASLDIADGTWVDIGLAMGAGIAPNGIVATMLWQSGEDPLTAAKACGQTSPNAGKGSPAPSPLPPPPAPSAPTTPLTLKSSASWAKVGQTITLTGTGFQPGERVAIQWDGKLTVQTVYANSASGFTISVPVPNGAYGAHGFYARGGTTGRSVRVPIQVGANLERTPTSGTPGPRVYVTAKGFGAYENVRLTWNGAAGGYLGTLSTNGTGNASGTIVIPGDSAGWHDFVGTGSRSGARGYGAIQVVAPAPTPAPATTALGITMDPRAGTPGTFVSVSVQGFAAGESLRISWGTDSQSFGTTIADRTGARTFAVPLPAQPQGVAILTVTGSRSGYAVHSAVVIQPRLVLSPGSGPMRTDVTATGLGFAANQPAYVVWRRGGEQSIIVCATRTDGAGTLRCNFLAPSTTGTGTMYVTAVSHGLGVTSRFVVTSSLAAAELEPEATDTDLAAFEPSTPEPGTPRVNMATPASGERILRGRDTNTSAADATTAAASPTVVDIEPAATPASGSAIRDSGTPQAGNDRPVRSLAGTPSAAPTPTATAGPRPTATPTDARPVRSPETSPTTVTTETPTATATEPTTIDASPAAVSPSADQDRTPQTPEPEASPAAPEPTAIATGPAPTGTEATMPTATPTEIPTQTQPVVPTETPTAVPTELPTETPTAVPTELPTEIPTLAPTAEPVIAQVVLVPVSDVSLELAPAYDAGTPTVLDPSALALPIGGPGSAVSYLTFQVDGVATGTVVDASLILTGAGETAGSTGTVTSLPGIWVDEWSATAATAPESDAPVLNATGSVPEPLWLTSGVESVIDVTGTVSSDGTITFVIPGTPDAVTGIASRESASPPRLILTVVRPAV